MTPEQIAAIKARAEAATKGPWTSPWDLPDDATEDQIYIAGPRGEMVVGTMWYDGQHFACAEQDAAFICHARSDVPALVAEVERLRKALEAAKIDFSRESPRDVSIALIINTNNAAIDRALAGEG